MTAATSSTQRPAAIDRPVAVHTGPRVVLGDALVVAGRNLRHLTRNPQLLVFATIQPVMFVLLFRYVFGGAIAVPNGSYVDYLMPGVFAQTVAFGAIATGVGLAEDLSKGLVDRFRSLPMARSAVLAGRTLADLVRNVGVVTLLVLVGMAVGFRVSNGVLPLLGGLALLLLFGFALSWIFALVGLLTADAESAQAAAFLVLFPLTFASSAFVPVQSMPGWLQTFAANQPVTVVVDAIRALVLGQPAGSKVLGALAWSVALLAVFVPLAVRRYRRTA